MLAQIDKWRQMKLKTFFKLLFSALGLLLIIFSLINVNRNREDVASGVTGDKIKQVKLGFTLEQVVEILGRPYKIDASQGLHNGECPNTKPRLEIDINESTNIRQIVDIFYNDTNYCCEGNKEDMQIKEVTLTYSRPVRLSKHFPMLWVHLDSSFNVYSVYAKQYDGLFGFDDPSIYSLIWEIDTTTLKMTSKIDYFIDESKFNDCFN